MTGSTISAIAFADYSLTSRIGVRGTIGYEMINLANEADTQCGRTNAEKCFADMSFFTAGLLGQFSLINMSMFELWLGGGSSLFQPMSSESSAISNVSTMFVLTLAGGIEIHVSKGFKIPLQFDYNFIPPTDTVLNTSFITGKFGLAFAF
jgi:opacity protein-like surface antigen